MRSTCFALMFAAALAALPACAFTQVRETVHRSVPAAGSPTVHVDNAVGGVKILGWDKPTVDVVAVKDAHSADDLKNIDIAVESKNSGVTIRTVNTSGGGFWHSGGVGYTIMVPTSASLDIRNETGGVRISGVRGDVVVRTTTGGIDGDLGKVAGKRNIDMQVTTGGIDVTIARDSSATLDLHTVVGGVKSEFPSNRVGSGSGRIRLQTTTGGVALHAS